MFPPVYYELREQIAKIGLDAFGIVPATIDPIDFERYERAVKKGYCADLSYLIDDPKLRETPRSVLPNARSIVVVALSERALREASSERRRLIDEKFAEQKDASRADMGAISGYATCLDYHEVLRARLKILARFFTERYPEASTRVAVDTAPLLEKSLAVRAGLGVVGRHTLLVAPSLGTRVFLGELLLSIPFETLTGRDASEEYLRAKAAEEGIAPTNSNELCKDCRRCVDACPVGALKDGFALDARKCLNYWTIENRGAIPPEIASALGSALFGCDRCQRVCPWNDGIESTPIKKVSLDAIESLDEEGFRALFKKTPIFRARLSGLRRVAAALRRTNAAQE